MPKLNLEDILSNKKYLFLDRDGVINKRIPDDYISKWSDFIFLPHVLDSLKIFASYFRKIIIVTNQQGIGKGIMTEIELKDIHDKLITTVEKNGGRIDAIYYCPQLKDEKDNCRKPSLKMATKAQNDFPQIDFSKSIMIGDTYTDMLFAKNAGMHRVLIQNKYTTAKDKELSNFIINNLNDISKLLKPVI